MSAARPTAVAVPFRRPLANRRRLLLALLTCGTLAVVPSAANAQWRSEPVPGEDVVSLKSLAFDARGHALLSWEGFAQTGRHKFTALGVRPPGGAWQRAIGLADITWGNAQIRLYGSDRALLVAGRASSFGAFNRARWRLVYAFGRSDGRFGAQRALADRVSLGTVVTATDPRGDALVAWQDERGVTKLRERPAGGRFAATRTLQPGGTGAAAMNLRGDRVLAWWGRDGVYARVRRQGRPWGPARLAARARPITNASVRAAVTAGGRVVLAWASAEIREDRPATLRSGVALLDGGRWRAEALERASVTHASSLPETAQALPVVDSAGRVYVAWTGVAGGALAVKLARVAAAGPRRPTVLSAGIPGAALNDAAAGPTGALLVAWSVQNPVSNVVYASLRRGGTAFAAPQQLTPDGVYGFGAGRAAIAASTGEAVVVWTSSVPGATGRAQASVAAPP